MKKLFYILVLAATFSSCTDVVKVELEKGETMLVVDAFLNDSAVKQTVRLTTTADYFSNTAPPPVLGAAVALTDITAGKTYTFTPDGYGNYNYFPSVNDSMAQVNHLYRLDIAYNGGNYMALSKLNRTTKIDTILFERQKTGTEDTSANPKKYFPYLIAKDAPGAIDYYWIKTYRNGVFYNGSGQLNVVQDAGGPGSDGIYIIPPNAFFLLTPDSDPCYYLDLCTIEVCGISAETYDFLMQMQVQMNNSQAGLFATAAENVRTNINKTSSGGMKAIGWFTIGAINSKSVYAK